jgi:hypothetical protein
MIPSLSFVAKPAVFNTTTIFFPFSVQTDEATATHAAGGTAAVSGASSSAGGGGGGTASSSRAVNKKRKPPRRGGSSASGAEGGGGKSSSSGVTSSNNPNHQAVRDQMRRALEEDQYSAYGSIVDTDSDSDDGVVPVSGPGAVGGGVEYRGAIVRLDRAAIHQYATQYMATLAAKSSKISTGGGRAIGGGGTAGPGMNPSVAVGAPGVAAAGSFGVSLAYKDGPKGSGTKDSITSARSTPVPVAPASTSTAAAVAPSAAAAASSSSASVMDAMTRELEEEWDLDGGSIFGQTTGASNFTWYVSAFVWIHFTNRAHSTRDARMSVAFHRFGAYAVSCLLSALFVAPAGCAGSSAISARSGGDCGGSSTRRSSRRAGTAA